MKAVVYALRKKLATARETAAKAEADINTISHQVSALEANSPPCGQAPRKRRESHVSVISSLCRLSLPVVAMALFANLSSSCGRSYLPKMSQSLWAFGGQ